MRIRIFSGTFLVLAALAAGCGGGALVPVTGKISVKGAPVKGGTLIFSPVSEGEGSSAGKPGSAEISESGTFTIKSQGKDGIAAGKYKVSFTPPEQKLTEEQRKDPKYVAPPPLYMNMVPKDKEITIKAGETTIEVELVPK